MTFSRRHIPIAAAVLFGALFTWFMLATLLTHAAHAQSAPPVPTVTPDIGGLLQLLLSGYYLPAVGLTLVILVAAVRAGAAKFVSPWFNTKLGGYTTAYVTSYALYLGTTWLSGAAFDSHVLVMAFTAALTASGVLDHWRDVLALLTGQPVEQAAKIVVNNNVTMVLAVALLVGCAAGQSGCGAAQHGSDTVISCIEQNAGSIAASVADTWARCRPPGGAIDWACVENHAITDGKLIGGCALADIVQEYLTPPAGRAAPVDGLAARGALEDFRSKHAGGATYRTAKGDI
jgi:hypothetical protein